MKKYFIHAMVLFLLSVFLQSCTQQEKAINKTDAGLHEVVLDTTTSGSFCRLIQSWDEKLPYSKAFLGPFVEDLNHSHEETYTFNDSLTDVKENGARNFVFINSQRSSSVSFFLWKNNPQDPALVVEVVTFTIIKESNEGIVTRGVCYDRTLKVVDDLTYSDQNIIDRLRQLLNSVERTLRQHAMK